jgi:endonuclease/exonuclease/phosphatase family metal-dependent hydrolase
VSFNVLAPCWASPQYYHETAEPLLEREARRERIIHFLKSQAATTDVFALQETTELEMWYFKRALKDQFEGFGAYHYPYFWSSSVTKDLPWEPNGVAIFVKKAIFTNIRFQDIQLHSDGNHAAIVQARLKSNARKVRIASIHLDDESADTRANELQGLLTFLHPKMNHIDIIAGDFNDETKNGHLKDIVTQADFVDILGALHQEKHTSPYAWGTIDHVLVRNGTPWEGKVFNANLWQLYPDDERWRLDANLLMCGSDHFPIAGSFR